VETKPRVQKYKKKNKQNTQQKKEKLIDKQEKMRNRTT
jgi:hypothetical protein